MTVNLLHRVEAGDPNERDQWEIERSRLAAIVECSNDAIIGKTLEGTIFSWNAGAQRVYGFSKEEAIGAPIAIIIPPDLDGREPDILDIVRSGARFETFETKRRRKDGQAIDVSITVSPILDASGRIVGSSTIERDITRRKEIEQALRIAKEQAERASRAKSEFLANVSHELRTPMNAIIGMTELALGEELSPVVHDYIETANAAAARLLALLNDLLDFSRLETGRFELDPELFNLAELLDDAIRTLSLKANEKNIELVCHLSGDVPRWLIGDGRRLRQVLLNLVGNAIKFTEQGEVVLSVAVLEDFGDRVRLAIEVRDTGIGIHPDDQRRVFEPFEQVDSSSTRKHDGTGLGLAISKELIARMEGDLTVVSEPGIGSNFRATPVFAIGSPPADVRESADAYLGALCAQRVLVVDDNRSNLRNLHEMLANWSMPADLVQSAKEALARLRSARLRERAYSLLIVDGSMPGVDGFQLLDSARGERLFDGPAIVMLAAGERKRFDERAAALRLSAFLEKPVTQSGLFEAILIALDLQKARTREAHRFAPARHPLDILVAEDTPANQKVVRAILEKRGHRVVIAANGEEAIALLAERSFDVVLMDLQMPGVDGIEATRRIRLLPDPAKARIPIAAITAHALRGDRERCLAAGMNAYLAKPIDAARLLQTVEELGQPFANRAAGDGAPLTEAADRAVSRKSPPVDIDRDAALGRLGGDVELYRDLIAIFTEDAPRLIDAIRTNLLNRDFEEVRRAVHSVKGLAANFGARGTVALAAQMEELATARDLDALRVKVDQLAELVADLMDVLRREEQ